MEELTRLRVERGWTQQRLADESNVNKATINQIEKGRRSPNIDTLEKLANALGVGMADFFPKAQSPLPLPDFTEQRQGASQQTENVWQAEYLARAGEMLDRWEGELEEKLALAESNPVAFFAWLEEIRKFGRPHMMGVVSAFAATTDFRLEAVIGAGEFLGPYSDLWRRIEERVESEKTLKWTEEDTMRFREWCAEERAVR